MAALIIKDRALGVFGRRLVTDVDGAPCCCEDVPPSGCCVIHRLPTECVRTPGLDPSSCCTCGTRFRRSYNVDLSYDITAVPSIGTIPEYPLAGLFSVRTRQLYEYIVECVDLFGIPHYVMVPGSFRIFTAEFVGEFSDNIGAPVRVVWNAASPPPEGFGSFEEFFLAVGAAGASDQCALGVVHAYEASIQPLQVILQGLKEAILQQRPDIDQSSNWLSNYNSPFSYPPAVVRDPGLISMNEGACTIGYEEGLRCDCPRSYTFRYAGGSPVFYHPWATGGLPNPAISWGGSQACGLAVYAASNGGSLYSSILEGVANTGHVWANAAVSITTNVMTPCVPNPCAGSGLPVPLTPSEIERQIAEVLNGLL